MQVRPYYLLIAATHMDNTSASTKMPQHWGAPITTLPTIMFNLFCLSSVGSTSLDSFWLVLLTEEGWTKHKDGLVSQFSNVNIVAGLLLTTTAALLSTSSPLPDVFNYTTSSSYRLFFASFFLALGGLISGMFLLSLMSNSQCTAYFFRKKLARSRKRLYITLLVMAYPRLSVPLSAYFCALAIGTSLRDAGMRLVAFFVVPPTFLIMLMLWIILVDGWGDQEQVCQDAVSLSETAV